MATYNLNQASLDSLLKSHVSAKTEALIIQGLKDAGDYPTGKLLLPTETDLTGGSVTVSPTEGLFLELGAKVSVDLKASTGLVVALGDGNVTLTDTGPGGDLIIGGAGHDVIRAEGANNQIFGGSGLETIYAGAGPTTVDGGTGSEVIYGGAGAAAKLVVHAGSGHETVVGGSGPETIFGGIGPLVVHGGSGAELIKGGSGAETIMGGVGHQTIDGGTGSSDIYGGKGPQTIDGGTGAVTVHGGAGTELVELQKGHVTDEVLGGTGHTKIDIAQSSANIVSDKTHGGLTTITFTDGQKLIAKDATIVFSNGHTQIV